MWLYPVGYADVGYSPSEIAVKEVYEETGIEVEPLSLIAVLDGLRLGFTQFPLYSLLFHCRMLGGELRGHPLETRAVGFFARDNLPWPVAGIQRWGEFAFAAIDGKAAPRQLRPAPHPTLAGRRRAHRFGVCRSGVGDSASTRVRESALAGLLQLVHGEEGVDLDAGVGELALVLGAAAVDDDHRVLDRSRRARGDPRWTGSPARPTSRRPPRP